MSGDHIQQPEKYPDWKLDQKARRNFVGFFDVLIRIDKRLQRELRYAQKEVSIDDSSKEREN